MKFIFSGSKGVFLYDRGCFIELYDERAYGIDKTDEGWWK